MVKKDYRDLIRRMERNSNMSINGDKKKAFKVAKQGETESYLVSLGDLGIPDQSLENERCDAAGITKSYLDLTSLHGFRYIGEYNRSLIERYI